MEQKYLFGLNTIFDLTVGMTKRLFYTLFKKAVGWLLS